MCWMLLFAALGLAFELGMFDGMDRTAPYGSEAAYTEVNGASDRSRVSRARRLLFVYVTQTAGRLNWTSPLPRYMTDSALSKPLETRVMAARKRNDIVLKAQDNMERSRLDLGFRSRIRLWIKSTRAGWKSPLS